LSPTCGHPRQPSHTVAFRFRHLVSNNLTCWWYNNLWRQRRECDDERQDRNSLCYGFAMRFSLFSSSVGSTGGLLSISLERLGSCR
jgi:hypothetical protein